ncbi:MAG: sigma-54-dependent Fis family transcriptional regulator [Lentisphaerae bacterium]|nr:sigma-54-dependent Fis family transcriptional regulator [Lentisphaerota bacterium]MBT4814474.1 sigma-54-dependent Fis family transcriptional regulator [Lentisphaerota bacterium]MBT5608837.1 sigma-54-dependent Fis family transcriptional regulator [Lentisphaerota bacterium]MBT7061521.1 sigma-54-dependent Fis family transcriptional regulator [Lentisphaerota bacterium]MBT7843368.1 sigma-54-dependent Fis family transcriptional regulator [Lentisphaerota bacterium]
MPAKKHLSILIVDDQPLKLLVLEEGLREAGYVVETAGSPIEARPILGKANFDVVLSDLRMPGQDGLSFLRDLKEANPEQAVIVMTAYGTVATAVEAMKIGAFDYLQKPFSAQELMLKLLRLEEYRRLAAENRCLRDELSRPRLETKLIGCCAPMRKVFERIHAVAGLDTTVLVQGETGTGKELVARSIHETSHRSSAPFVAVSCAALPKDLVESELFGHEAGAFTGATKRRLGRFESARGGTIFLDDVDDIPAQAQVKLLRVLQEGTIERIGGGQPIRINVRVISATKQPLAPLVESGGLRQDLYYRLNVVPLHVPPLRDRREDIPLLIQHFIGRFSLRMNRNQLSITPGAISLLRAHDWPGNVRELEHVVERMAALSPTGELSEDDVPELLSPRNADSIVSLSFEGIEEIDMTAVLQATEARFIQWALANTDGNVAQAADLLNTPRSTFQYRLSKLAENGFSR